MNLILFFVFVIYVGYVCADSTFEIVTLKRTINLDRNVPSHAMQLRIKNVSGEKQGVFEVWLAKEGRYSDLVVENMSGLRLESNVAGEEGDYVKYSVKLGNVADQETLDLQIVDLGQLNVLKPKPRKISMGESQKLVYVGDVVFYSPYPVVDQSVEVSLPSHYVESYTKDFQGHLRGKVLSYGPIKDQEPFTKASFSVHYQNNSPFVAIRSLKRILDVNHWGSMVVEEHYHIQHNGAELKGGFSRIDYSKNPAQAAPSSFRKLIAKLPLNSQDIYFRDRIGNISTSTCHPSRDRTSLEVEFLPRFPLLGGWNATFYIGYTVPLADFMTIEGSRHTLRYQFGTPFPDAPIDSYELRIEIPGGSSNIATKFPFSIASETFEKRPTFLDFFGRDVVIVKKERITPDQSLKDFELSYDFSTMLVFHEPLIIVGAFFAVSVFLMFYVRFDLRIAKTPADIEEEQNEKAYRMLANFISQQLKRKDIYQQFQNVSNAFIRNGDEEKLNVEVEKLNKKLEQIESAINNLKSEFNKLESADIDFDAINKIESKETTRNKELKKGIQCKIAYKKKKYEFTEYVKRNQECESKITSATNSIDRILSTLL